MRKTILALALLGSSVSAGAVTIVGEIQGAVTSSFATEFTKAGAPADIKVGDTITARFSYVRADPSGGSAGFAAGNLLGAMITDQISFELAGYRWTSRGDFLDGMVPLAFGAPEDPLANFYLTTDDAPGAGDLRVQGYAFEIGEFGYGLYQGFGYAGSFDRSTLKFSTDGKAPPKEQLSAPVALQPDAVTAVPEPASWAMMIGGFGLIGATLRSARRKTSLTFATA